MRLNKLLVPLAFSMLFSSGAISTELPESEVATTTITNYSQSSNGAIHFVTVALPDLGDSWPIRCVIRMNDLPVGMVEDTIKGVGTLDIHINGGIPDATKAECYRLVKVPFTFGAEVATTTITNYTQSSNGAIHWVTVAFSDIEERGNIRCVIRMNDLPVGMVEDTIKGVGTLDIHINGGIPDATKAECMRIE